MKNKKGFTLVEIIITLAIVITITTVAVGSYIGISSQKKKEEWKLVQNQIETAAEQYFSSNKYLYEGLYDDASKTLSANISVGKLVKEDYLNKIVDPTTGKQVSYCSEIQVTIKNGKYSGKFVGNQKSDDEESCKNGDQVITISTPDGPTGEMIYHKYAGSDDKLGAETNANNGWFNVKSLDEGKPLIACVNITKNNIVNATLNDEQLKQINKKWCKKVDQGKYDNQRFFIEDNLGRRTIIVASYNVDSISPTCETNAKEGTNDYTSYWTKNNVTLTSNCNDDISGSGCVTNSKSKVKSTSVNSVSGEEMAGTDKFKDHAGNTGTCPTKNVKVDKTSPKASIHIDVSRLSGWNSKFVYLSYEAQDNLSGLNTYTVDNNDKVSQNEKGMTTKWSKKNDSYDLNSDYDGENKTVSAVTCDMVGNCSYPTSNNYRIYKNCTDRTDTGEPYNKGTCNTCGATTTSATQGGTDNHTGAWCSRTVTVSCTPSCAVSTNPYGTCGNKGYRKTKITKSNCCKDEGPEQNCGVDSIYLDLDTDEMEAPGPNGDGGPIFKSGVTHVNEYSNRYNRGIDVSVGGTTYAGASCKNVRDFSRYFKYKIKWEDGTWSDYRHVKFPKGTGDNTYVWEYSFGGRVGGELTFALWETNHLYRYGCQNRSPISTSCGSSSGATPNLTRHQFYIRGGGQISNYVTLWTKYFGNCGY